MTKVLAETISQPTTIKVSKMTRDRLKASAALHNRTIEEHLNFLEDLHAREQRWDAMRDALARMSPQDWADYQSEAAALSGTDLDGLDDETW